MSFNLKSTSIDPSVELEERVIHPMFSPGKLFHLLDLAANASGKLPVAVVPAADGFGTLPPSGEVIAGVRSQADPHERWNLFWFFNGCLEDHSISTYMDLLKSLAKKSGTDGAAEHE